MRFPSFLHRMMCHVLLVGVVLFSPSPARAEQECVTAPADVQQAVMRLLDQHALGLDAAKLDMGDLGEIVRYVACAPRMEVVELAERNKAEGAFVGLDVERSLPSLADYLFSTDIPISALCPSTIKLSEWAWLGDPAGGRYSLAEAEKKAGLPLVVRGVQLECTTPDTNSGSYYCYQLDRTLIWASVGEDQAIFSISSLQQESEPGMKGAILGSDNDLNYLYTGQPGTRISGLSWVKPKITLSDTVSVYTWNPKQDVTSNGVFQGLRAGWAGMNVVKSDHIGNGSLRYARTFKKIAESPRLPDPAILRSQTLFLRNGDERQLRTAMRNLLDGLYVLAAQDAELVDESYADLLREPAFLEAMSRTEMVAALMKEYVKKCVGMESPVSDAWWLSAACKEADGIPTVQ